MPNVAETADGTITEDIPTEAAEPLTSDEPTEDPDTSDDADEPRGLYCKRCADGKCTSTGIPVSVVDKDAYGDDEEHTYDVPLPLLASIMAMCSGDREYITLLTPKGSTRRVDEHAYSVVTLGNSGIVDAYSFDALLTALFIKADTENRRRLTQAYPVFLENTGISWVHGK